MIWGLQFVVSWLQGRKCTREGQSTTVAQFLTCRKQRREEPGTRRHTFRSLQWPTSSQEALPPNGAWTFTDEYKIFCDLIIFETHETFKECFDLNHNILPSPLKDSCSSHYAKCIYFTFKCCQCLNKPSIAEKSKFNLSFDTQGKCLAVNLCKNKKEKYFQHTVVQGKHFVLKRRNRRIERNQTKARPKPARQMLNPMFR